METEIEIASISCSAPKLARYSFPVVIWLGKCEVCSVQNAKYTCPKCEVKTCSIKCNKIHKVEIECDGLRDKTKFLPLNRFTNMDFESDYKLLEGISEGIDSIKKKFGRRKDTHILPAHLFKLRNAAQHRKTTLKFLPYTFSRHRNNTTQLNFKTNCIWWHIDWIFVNADNLCLSEFRVPETEKLGSVLSRHLLKSDDHVVQETLQYYQSADISGLKLLLKAEQKNGNKFYELDHTLTIKENLAKRVIIEYPIIHVLLKDHCCNYKIIDSDEEGEGEGEKNNKIGSEVVKQLISQAESDEKSNMSLKNLLFVSDNSDGELSA